MLCLRLGMNRQGLSAALNFSSQNEVTGVEISYLPECPRHGACTLHPLTPPKFSITRDTSVADVTCTHGFLKQIICMEKNEIVLMLAFLGKGVR